MVVWYFIFDLKWRKWWLTNAQSSPKPHKASQAKRVHRRMIIELNWGLLQSTSISPAYNSDLYCSGLLCVHWWDPKLDLEKGEDFWRVDCTGRSQCSYSLRMEVCKEIGSSVKKLCQCNLNKLRVMKIVTLEKYFAKISRHKIHTWNWMNPRSVSVAKL